MATTSCRKSSSVQSSPMESRSSDRKLKPLPPDPLRHQDSAIAHLPRRLSDVAGSRITSKQSFRKGNLRAASSPLKQKSFWHFLSVPQRSSKSSNALNRTRKNDGKRVKKYLRLVVIGIFLSEH